MNQQIVDDIKEIQEKLAETINAMQPQNPSEWNAHDALTAAHKSLRKIDPDSLADRERRNSATR